MAVTELRFRVMASDAQVIVTDAADGIADVGRELLVRLEHRWSRFLPDSDISRINRARGRPTVVDATTITLVETMVDAWHATAGRCDPTVLPVLVANGYEHSVEDARHATVLPPGPLRIGHPQDVAIDVARSTVTAPPGTVLDPGGIGKGLAADLVVAELLAAGARGALVDVGGDIAFAGEPPHPDGWRVTVEHPDRPAEDLCTLTVDAGGVATSSTRSRRWRRDGIARHHLIDPATGRQSTTDLAAVTVFARCGWLAEAHATGALLAGTMGVLDYLDTNDLTGLAVTATGTVITTSDLGSLMDTVRSSAP